MLWCNIFMAWCLSDEFSFSFSYLTEYEKVENQNKLACNVQNEEFCYRILTGWTHLSITFTMKIQRVCFLVSSLRHEKIVLLKLRSIEMILHVTRVYFYNLPEVKHVQMILLEDLLYLNIKNFMPLIFLLPIYTVCIHVEYRYARIANWKTLTVSIIHSVAM